MLIYLNLWPVGGHAWTVIVLPPFEIVLLVDGHQSLVELTVNGLHTGTRMQRQWAQATSIKRVICTLINTHKHSGGCWPLVVGDVQVSVDGQEDLLEKADPLPLLLLRLFENGFHLLHIARCVGRHVLQEFLISISSLQAETILWCKVELLFPGRTSAAWL